MTTAGDVFVSCSKIGPAESRKVYTIIPMTARTSPHFKSCFCILLITIAPYYCCSHCNCEQNLFLFEIGVAFLFVWMLLPESVCCFFPFTCICFAFFHINVLPALPPQHLWSAHLFHVPYAVRSQGSQASDMGAACCR